MKKENIDKLIREALKETKFILRNYGEVELSQTNPINVLFKEDFTGIHLDEGEDTVNFTLDIKYVIPDPNGLQINNAKVYNLIAKISADSAIIQKNIHFDK
ncbi:hypothetical protein [Macellibacteroides fermentans]|uniref:hypothetical protein n=1 Tax=Macellibacteroides fermentans TaxID=879969 RepID=UPI00406C17A7